MSSTNGLLIVIMTLAVVCAGLVTQSRCSSSTAAKQTVNVSEKDNDGKITVAIGGTIILRLEARPGTGYSWSLAKNEPAKLKLEGETIEQPTDPRLDGVEYPIFRFNAVAEGTVALELRYTRSWEKDAPPAKLFRLTVEIR